MKYVVEVAAPKAGEIASSGGIRAGGKLVSQFKNPVPYVEPPKAISNSAVQLGVTLGVGLLKIGVDHYIMPVFTHWCDAKRKTTVKSFEKTEAAKQLDKTPKPETETKKSATIIQFPNVS